MSSSGFPNQISNDISSRPREAEFHALDRHQLGEWLSGIGLDMYRELVEQEVPSGARLVEIANDNPSLIVSTEQEELSHQNLSFFLPYPGYRYSEHAPL